MITTDKIEIEEKKENPFVIAEYSEVDAAIAKLTEEYDKERLPDVETKEGYEFIKKGIATIRGYRTKLEKKRKELKAPIITRGKLLDSEAKRITEALQKLEQPMAKLKKDVDEKEAREKEARINEQKARVQKIIDIPKEMRGKSSEEVSKALDELTEMDCTQGFYEQKKEALEARKDSLEQLADILAERLKMEALEAENAENKEKREREERINRIKYMPVDMIGKPSQEIQDAIFFIGKIEGQIADDLDISPIVEKLSVLLEDTMRREEEATKEPLASKVKSCLKPKEKKPEFRGAELLADVAGKELDVLSCYFFGHEMILEVQNDTDGNEYNLELVLRRKSLKGA